MDEVDSPQKERQGDAGGRARDLRRRVEEQLQESVVDRAGGRAAPGHRDDHTDDDRDPEQSDPLERSCAAWGRETRDAHLRYPPSPALRISEAPPVRSRGPGAGLAERNPVTPVVGT